jgi:hypothetical protein
MANYYVISPRNGRIYKFEIIIGLGGADCTIYKYHAIGTMLEGWEQVSGDRLAIKGARRNWERFVAEGYVRMTQAEAEML